MMNMDQNEFHNLTDAVIEQLRPRIPERILDVYEGMQFAGEYWYLVENLVGLLVSDQIPVSALEREQLFRMAHYLKENEEILADLAELTIDSSDADATKAITDQADFHERTDALIEQLRPRLPQRFLDVYESMQVAGEYRRLAEGLVEVLVDDRIPVSALERKQLRQLGYYLESREILAKLAGLTVEPDDADAMKPSMDQADFHDLTDAMIEQLRPRLSQRFFDYTESMQDAGEYWYLVKSLMGTLAGQRIPVSAQEREQLSQIARYLSKNEEILAKLAQLTVKSDDQSAER